MPRPRPSTAPFDRRINAASGHFSLARQVSPTRLPPVWALPTGLDGVDAARIASSTGISPALHEVHVRFHACSSPAEQQASRAIRTAHIVTPETATTTHCFIHHGRTFGQDDPAITGFMHSQLLAAFQEDINGREALEANLAHGPAGTAHDINFQADTPVLAMRRGLKQRAAASAPAPAR